MWSLVLPRMPFHDECVARGIEKTAYASIVQRQMFSVKRRLVRDDALALSFCSGLVKHVLPCTEAVTINFVPINACLARVITPHAHWPSLRHLDLAKTGVCDATSKQPANLGVAPQPSFTYCL